MKYHDLYLCKASILRLLSSEVISEILMPPPSCSIHQSFRFAFVSIWLTEVYTQRNFFFISKNLFHYFLTLQDATLRHAHKNPVGSESLLCKNYCIQAYLWCNSSHINRSPVIFIIKVSRAAFRPSSNVTFLNTDKYRQSQYILLIIAFYSNVSFCGYRALEDVALFTLGYLQ